MLPACVLSHFSHVLLFVTPWTGSPPGSSVHGFLQAGILERVAMPSSRESSRPRDGTYVSMSPALGSRFFTTRANIATRPLEGKVSPYLGTTDQNWILKNPLKNMLLSCIYDFTHPRDFYLPALPCPNTTTSLQGQAPMLPPSCVFSVERASPISSLCCCC